MNWNSKTHLHPFFHVFLPDFLPVSRLSHRNPVDNRNKKTGDPKEREYDIKNVITMIDRYMNNMKTPPYT